MLMFDLQFQRGKYQFPLLWWERLLDTAYRRCNWQPDGTVIEADPFWDGTYIPSGRGQFITAKDAAALAAALRELVDDVPEIVDEANKIITVSWQEYLEFVPDQLQPQVRALGEARQLVEAQMLNPYMDALEFFGGDTRNDLKLLAEKLEQGECRIW